ncbi:MAG: hypothetical protein COX65_07065 [Elusimicrobia bacterium CG_4_10_14_0_2_um_filter_56_8]|nr:MAG: hypothetical protein AUJ51_11215 [Elusimicrobia bacterium CG1_02_56_21]PJA13449.1 MAG: hypothetical protein COX65_07065 [Elusimicrobia bacterium CG_4_10_14_0_2_um_filter_56_8]
MINTSSIKFGLLLDYFFRNEKAVLSAPAAAGLSGLGVKRALGALEMLENAGVLRSMRCGRTRFYSADTRSIYYRHYRWGAHRAARMLN